jgi:tetratricopeptide (TPR) repeat protein
LFCVVSINYSQINLNLENKFRLATSYEQANQFERAEQIYKELVNIQPWNTSYFDALNKCFIKQKKYDSSINLIAARIIENPNDITLYGMLGSTYYMSDQIKLAHESWEKGIQTNPTSFVVYRVIANYALENRAFDKAIEILIRGKSTSAEQEIFSLDLANIYTASMQFRKATEEYCDLLNNKPEQIGVVKSRIASYITRRGASGEVFHVIENYINKFSKPQFSELISYCHSLVGNYDAALKHIIKYESQTNGIGTHIFTLAQEAFRYRQYKSASNAFEYFIKNYSDSQLLSVAKISHAKTLEASLDQKNESSYNRWKTLQKQQNYKKDEYNSLIKVYENLAKEFHYNSIFIEATYRMAEIYMNRIYNFEKADSLFSSVIENGSFTNYAVLANISKGKISIQKSNLTEASHFFSQALSNERREPSIIAECNFYLAKINFWNGKFSEAKNYFNETLKNLAADYSNDAIEYLVIINAAKKDSVYLCKYASADLAAFQNKLLDATIELKTLADNDNLFLLNEFSKIKLAEIFILSNEYMKSIELLKNLNEDEKVTIFSDKSTFLLGLIYQFGILDSQKALLFYQKILEKFENSLYFDMARELFNSINTENGKNE